MKILINTPDISIIGGVANHYKGLKNYWNEEVEYNYVAGRNGIPGEIIIFYDILKFVIKIFHFNPDLIILNPSLGKTAIKRDAIYLRISKFLKIKTIVFFHGWSKYEEKAIDEKPAKFVNNFSKSDGFIVLATEFKEKLKQWGIQKPIELTTTKVDNSLVEDLNLVSKDYGDTLLFLARIEKEKGILIVLETFKELKKKVPSAKLKVAGSGGALQAARDYVKKYGLDDVAFTGFISGEELIEVFKTSDIYFFPTAHGEGMPTSVLEAMAFGLPIITRPVGGIMDFFEEGKMGYLIESLEPYQYNECILTLLKNQKRLESIGQYNHQYAKNNFLASKVAKSLESLFENFMNNDE